jgi:homospermidine synthase
MAEIKSAIELAMEKTRDLVVDSKEREAMAIKDIEDKVKAVLRRYMEEMVDDEDAAKELNKINADLALKRTLIVDTVVEGFDVHKNNERLLALMYAAGIELPETIRSELETLNKAFREDVEARKMVIRERIRDNLAESGIAGSGIEPNLVAWDEWQEEVEKAGNAFKKRMEELKDKIKATKRNL